MVASRMAPVASITRKQAPNWRVATMRRSMIGLRAGQPPRNHQHERQTANDRERDDEGRAEPVILQAAVQHHLERAEKSRDQHEADDVEPDALLLRPCRRARGRGLPQDQRDQRHRDHADRCVDQKAPVPGDIVGQPAAERRPDHRGNHHGDAEHRKGLAALRRRKRIRQDRLRDRHHAATAEALQDAEQQQRIQIRRKTAQQRAER